MKNIFLILSLFILASSVYASQVTIPTVYQNGGTVTAANLNGNFTAIVNVLNGGLDNSNANTTSGYRFYQTVAVLPSPGNQGAVYFLTSDNTLNFDTGAAFIKSVAVASPTNGDLLYYNSGWQKRAIGANHTILSSDGSVPSWGYTVGTSANNIVQLDASSKLPAVDGSQLTNLTQVTLGSILDYGTSGSTSTAKNQTALKIAYGNTGSLAGPGGTFNITNLPFASSSSYRIITTQTDTGTTGVGYVTQTSGSAAVITNAAVTAGSNVSHTFNWYAIGT